MKKIISFLFVLVIAAFTISADFAGEITGNVMDDEGTPIQGVKVSVKNTQRSVYSDLTGNFRISVMEGDKVLVFTCNGFVSKEILIENHKNLNVILFREGEVNELEKTTATRPSLHKAKLTPGAYAGDMRSEASMPFYFNHFGVPRDFNTEGYSTIHENGYKEAISQPLSTFSIDVDKASYSNIRRFINMGQLPPVDAVRIEEMINYFNYDYPEPGGEQPFSVYTELSACPWNEDHYLFHIGLKGRNMDKTELPPSNLVFLIDVSGSMGDPNKLPLLKSAFQLLVKELRSSDRVAIVVYAGAAGVALKSTPGNQNETILNSLNELQAGGSTAGGQGIMLAYKIAHENFIHGGNNRIILATDGDFNVGASSNAEMERLIEVERGKGIFITVLGFGMGNYKDDKMEIIADKGNGNYAYIDNIQEARKVLVGEFAGTLFTIAKDVKFQLEFNPARVKAYRLLGYENRLLNDEDFNNDKKDAGEMGAGHTITALYEIIPAGSEESTSKIDPLKYQENKKQVKPDVGAELLTIKLRYKNPDGEASKQYEKAVKTRSLPLSETSENFRFSAAVAEFGMILRNSEYKGQSSYEHLLMLTQGSRGKDTEGYRGEFVKLVQTVRAISGTQVQR